jgi:Phosphotransferase enzyme family
MKTIDSNNVFEYLAEKNYCELVDRDTSKTKTVNAKNFNLAIEFSDGRHLLVKQERHNDRGESKGEFWAAWRIGKSIEQFPALGEKIGDFLPELLHFDPDNSILIVNYRSNYCDLDLYYNRERLFPTPIARSIGKLLAQLHGHTFQQSDYQQYFDPELVNRANPFAPDLDRQRDTSYTAIDIIRRLTRITPSIFRQMPLECLQFLRLFQRFPSLTQAIAELAASIEPSCVIHNDLKLNNILLDLDWERPASKVISLIDWERTIWGDPAFDLGCMLGSYLEIWLEGLAVSNLLSINESLQLAITPLELLQPSLRTLVQSYLAEFPEILVARPDYLDRAIQFAGLALVQRIEITIDEERTFGNGGIVMLQVAKQLICTPRAAMKTLFDRDLTQLVAQ